jgi:hypothetical protein
MQVWFALVMLAGIIIGAGIGIWLQYLRDMRVISQRAYHWFHGILIVVVLGVTLALAVTAETRTLIATVLITGEL